MAAITVKCVKRNDEEERKDFKIMEEKKRDTRSGTLRGSLRNLRFYMSGKIGKHKGRWKQICRWDLEICNKEFRYQNEEQ